MEKYEPREEWLQDSDAYSFESQIALQGLVDVMIKEADERAFAIMHKIAKKAIDGTVKVI